MAEKPEGGQSMEGQPNGQVGGVYVQGYFLGVQPPRTFDRKNGEKGTEPAKIGIRLDNGQDLPVAVGTEDDLREVTRGWVKGDFVRYGPIEARPPFGSSGAVRYQRPGLSDRGWL